MITVSVGLDICIRSAPALVLTGIGTNGVSAGDTLGAYVSSGAAITSYAWGTSLGLTDYGASATLFVPELAQGTQIYLLAMTATSQFAASIMILPGQSLDLTEIAAGIDMIEVRSLADKQPLPTLTPLPSIDSITLEIA